MADTLETMKCPSVLDNDLVARLKHEFTTEEQELFLQSFSAYLNHGPTDFVIDLDDVYEWVGFSEKGKAKRLIVKEFEDGKDFQSACPQRQALLNTTRNGGQNRQQIMMSVRTFKRFCMLAKTGKKADTVREYYLTMEEVMMEYLKDREADNVHKLMETKNAGVLTVERITADTELLIAQQKHRILIAAHRGVGGVYIATIVSNGVKYQKIGGTDDIWKRKDSLPNEFDNKTILFAWFLPHKRWRRIEKLVKKVKDVVPHFVGVPKRNGKLSTETFCLTNTFSMDTLIAHVKRVAVRVESEGPCKSERAESLALLQAHNTQDALQIRRRELDLAETSAAAAVARSEILVSAVARMTDALCQDTRNNVLASTLQALVAQLSIPMVSPSASQPKLRPTHNEFMPDHVPIQSDPVPTQPDRVPTDTEVVVHHKQRANGRGQGVQQYEIVRQAGKPDEFKLLKKVFNGPTDAARHVNLNTGLHASASGISDACKISAEYCGFRWVMVATADLQTPQELVPTANIKRERSAMVAMISLDQSRVVDVFASQKVAATTRKVVQAAISRALKLATKSTGHYWKLWTDVGVEMQNIYKMSHSLPGNVPQTGSIAIELFNPCDGTLYKMFDSTQEAIDRMQVSRISIANAITDGLPMKGYVWRYIR